MAQSDVFVFLDDAQFSKNSYINRTRILGPSGARWLTVPVSYRFGDSISSVQTAVADWRSRHLDTLLTCYRSARCFRDVWPDLQGLYDCIPGGNLGSVNLRLVKGIAARLGMPCRFAILSQIAIDGLSSDDRVVALAVGFDLEGTYVSGREGAEHQAKFMAAGIVLRYTDFEHPGYDQGGAGVVEGLSIVDAVFRPVWKGASDLTLRRC